MQVALEQYNDFMKDTLADLGEPDFTDISSDLTQHVAMDELLQENHAEISSGSQIQFNLLVAQSNQAKHVSPGEPDNPGMRDGMIQGHVPWRCTQTNYILIHQIVTMNGGKRQIVDFVKQQRLMALISLAELMEKTFWNPPVATDAKTPFGLPYYVTKSTTKGFTGDVLAGWPDVAGILPSQWPRFQNYVYPYNQLTRDDFTRGAREASVACDFRPTVPGIPQPYTGKKMGYYCGYPVYQALEDSLENQNDSLGADIASQDGKPMFHGVPVTYVPFLNGDATNPFYGIDWGWAKIAIARGEWMRETQIPHSPTSHNIAANYIDLMWNLLFKNRRAAFVVTNGATYPG